MADKDNTTNPPPDGLPEEWHADWKDAQSAQGDFYVGDYAGTVLSALGALATERKARLEAEARAEAATRMVGIKTSFVNHYEGRAKAAEAFKRYVHERLDQMGVPVSPSPPKHALSGCRIGDRLDWVEAQVAQLTRERDEWADTIRSVAPGCIPSAAAAKTAIRELREGWLAATKERDEARAALAHRKEEMGAAFYAHRDELDRLRELLREAQNALGRIAASGTWAEKHCRWCRSPIGQADELRRIAGDAMTVSIDAELSSGGSEKDGK